MNWPVFAIVFILLCLKEGAKVSSDNKAPASRFLRWLYRRFRCFYVERMGGDKTGKEADES